MDKDTLREILIKHRLWLKGRSDGEMADLSDADLAGADLRLAELSEANLNMANLQGADLTGARLIKADLADANLAWARLNKAKLDSADLTGAYLVDASLRGASLSGAKLNHAELSVADLTGANLSSAYLRGANLSGASLGRSNLANADLTGADLTGTALSPLLHELQREFVKLCPVVNRHGGRLLWRTYTSPHMGTGKLYHRGTYVAPWFSMDADTNCHPGIYASPLEWMTTMYNGSTRIVLVYVRDGDWVITHKAIRCKRLRVIGAPIALEDALSRQWSLPASTRY